MNIVTRIDRPKSIHNRCVIEVFGGVFMLSLCFLDFSVGVGAFVIGLSQISSFFLLVMYGRPFFPGIADSGTPCFGPSPLVIRYNYRLHIGRGFYEKKEEIWLSPMTKAPTPTEKSKKHRDNIKNANKTSITQRLRTDLGWSVGVTAVNATGVVKPVNERSTFPLTATAV